ncbi:NAD(P)/FAD-dependent oxidoreductase [Marinobacterium rhizophilum]|uniref:NAD(P)/FAD-dependent oxidoreductase n=1 Tax=Marinobacterium rhizophilum TaxID=420402 RepID=UPI001969BF2B|nr:FAD-dependent oxidoreductase [Marinobacterium rhizophilum]
MSALTRALLGQLSINISCRITQVQRRRQQWLLHDQNGNEHGPFSHLVLAIPAPQATALLNTAAELAAMTGSVDMQPSWAVALAFEQPLQTSVEACFVEDNALAWVARDSSKPGRDGQHDNWILHASDAWSAQNLELPAAAVVERLKNALSGILGCALPEPALAQAHRWLYARPSRAQPWGALADATEGLHLCGDWCLSGRVEDAWHSGQLAAQQLLDQAALNAGRTERSPITHGGKS